MFIKFKNQERRREVGKMFLDIAKYLATVGLIGGVLTNSVTIKGGFIIAFIIILLVFLAFYVIPPKMEDN